MKPWMRFGIALTLVAGIGACSGDGSGQDYDDTVDAASAESAASFAFDAAHEMMGALAGGGGPAAPQPSTLIANAIRKGFAPVALPAEKLPRGWRPLDLSRVAQLPLAANGMSLAAPPGCSTSESGIDGSGDPIDGNANGIPDEYRQEMHCEFSEEIAPDSTVIQKIDLVVSFVERMSDFFGYDIKVHQSVAVTSNFGAYQKQVVDQEQGISLRADRASTHELSLIEMRIRPVGDSVEHHVEVEQRGDMRFTPETDIVLESPLPDGTVKLNGEFRVINSDEPIAIRFVLDTPEELEFSNACAISDDQPFVGGILRGRYDGRSSVGFTIEFNACGLSEEYETFGIEGGVAAPRFHP